VSVPGYEILGELGRGGMGVVYQACQAELNRIVALKMILAGGHAGQAELARFRTEARAVARLQHPNIVQIHEVGEHQGLPFFSLEYCAGGSLEKKLSGTPLPPREAAALVQTLARAMQAAHDRGVVHRDLKPANVLLAEDGTPKVTDFGLAKKLDETGQTASGSVLGTPSYMAPEQAAGSKAVGPAADVWALGAILYECLAGRPPFKAATALDTLMQVVADEPVPPRQLTPKLPNDLENICLKCLQKEPRKRYASAQALADDLAAYLDGRPTVARPVGRLERAWRWCRRNRALAASAAAAVLALVAGTIAATAFAIKAKASAEKARLAADQAEQKSEEARQAQEKEARQRETADRQVIDLLVSTGNRMLRGGDPGGSLPWFAEAGRLDPADSAHRTRLDGALRFLPRPVAFWRHTEAVTHVAVSPDGRRVVSGSSDGTAILWDLESGKAIGQPLKHEGPVMAVAFSPDGGRVATAGGAFLVGGEVHLWDAHTGAEVRLRKPVRVSAAVVFVGFTADGARLITCEYSVGVPSVLRLEQKYVFRVWDLKTAARLTKTEADLDKKPVVEHIEPYLHAGTGRLLVIKGQRAWIIDLVTGKTLGEPWGHDRRIGFGRLSPDGARAITMSGEDGVAKIHEISTNKLTTLTLAKTGVGPRDVSLDERGEVAVAFADGVVARYRMDTGLPVGNDLGKIGTPGWRPRFSADGAFVAGLGQAGAAGVWETVGYEPVTPVLRHGAGLTACAFAAEGRRLVVGAQDGSVRVWDLARSEPPAGRFDTDPSFRYSRVDFDHDVALITGAGIATRLDLAAGQYHFRGFAPVPSALVTGVSCDGKRLAIGAAGGQVHLLDAATLRDELPPLKHELRVVVELALSPDGRRLVTRSASSFDGFARLLGEVHVWDLTTGKPITTTPLRRRGGFLGMSIITSVAFAPDSRRFAASSGRMTKRGIVSETQLYDADTAQPLNVPLPATPGTIPAQMAFSADGRFLAVLSYQVLSDFAEVAVWDLPEGRRKLRISLANPRSDLGMALGGDFLTFDPAGRLAVAAGAEVQVWDAARGKLIHRLPHSQDVAQLRYQREGRVLLSVAGSEIGLWDALTGQALRPPVRQSRWVDAAGLSPDGHYLVSTGQNTVWVWDLSGGTGGGERDKRLARLLSCQTVEGTTAVPVDVKNLAEDWEKLRARATELLRPTDEAVAAWHDRQGNRLGELRSWAAAERQFQQKLAAKPGDALGQFYLGSCCMATDDKETLRQQAADMVRRYAASPNLFEVEWTLRIALTEPDAFSDRAAILRLADRLKDSEMRGEGSAWWPVARGLALYRAGSYAEAATCLDRARGRKDKSVHSGAMTDLLLAMTRSKQGKLAEARDLLAAATRDVERAEKGWHYWTDGIHCRRVLREAQGALAKP
jgi:WD40 repeat protein